MNALKHLYPPVEPFDTFEIELGTEEISQLSPILSFLNGLPYLVFKLFPPQILYLDCGVNLIG